MVTYRTLSRALKVHVTTAKGMLYEFHRWQNATSPGKVHATYLIYGTKSAGVQEDGDHEMTSSPPELEPMGDEVPTQTLTIVTEERLKDILATYQEVTSFQVYSLASFPNKEYQLLSDVSRELLQYAHEDPVEMAPTYGSITNPNMKRRERKTRPQAQPASRPAEKKAPVAAAPSPAPEVKEEPKAAAAKDMFAKAKKTGPNTAAPAKPPPSLKRGGSSGIMSAFSKAAAKAPKAGSKPSSNASTPKPVDSPALSDDGEDDEDPLPAPKRAATEGGRKSRKDREAALRQMMEESEEEPEEEEEEKEEEPADEPMEDVHEPELEKKAEPKAEQPDEVMASTGDGRRRGRRRVMKKVQKMDKEGYFITTQEEAWESFSEEEQAPAKDKASTAPSSGTQSKAKKAAAKGQGNIMSFFSKK
ncbi:hypothetical protein ACHAQH_008268 [Verticillium albo-atrum]